MGLIRFGITINKKIDMNQSKSMHFILDGLLEYLKI